MSLGGRTALFALLLVAPLASMEAQDGRRGRQAETPAPRREERPEPRRVEPERRRQEPETRRRDEGGNTERPQRTEKPAPARSTGDPELRRRKP